MQLGSQRPPPKLPSAILVGGESRRFGQRKETLRVQGQTLLDRNKSLLTEALHYPPMIIGTESCPDIRPNKGPLAGIETALSATNAEHVFILACDMPAISMSLINLIACFQSNADIVLPVVGKHRHPLCARWHRNTLPAIKRALDQNSHSVLRLVDSLESTIIGETQMRHYGVDPERELWNVNTMDDWSKYLGEAEF